MTVRTHPFGWLTPYLVPVIRRDPAKLDLYISLGRADWHYVGFIIAMMGDDAACPAHFAAVEQTLFSAKRRAVLAEVAPDHSAKLVNLLPKLTGDLWRPASYRRFASLTLMDGAMKAFQRRRTISRRYVRALSRLPHGFFDPAIVSRIKTTEEAQQVAFFVEIVRRVRTDMTEQEVLRSLAQVPVSKNGELHRWVGDHYAHAPFPTPPWVGTREIQPITSYADLKRLALEFDNCVRNYHEDVLGGRSYFYRYAENGKALATVELQHLPRVGWLVGEVAGKNNDDVPRSVRLRIDKAFGEAGFGAMPNDVSRWDLFKRV